MFVRNARLYELVLEGMWKRGEDDALAISSLLEQRGLGRSKILDVPCGIGRVGIQLAQLGYNVVGLDFSPHLVGVAKAKAKRLDLDERTSFTVGKMSDVASVFAAGSFDCAINVFTSIGYGKDQDDLHFFRGLRKVIRDGGLFIISGLRNRDFIVTHPAANVYEEGEKLLVLDKYRFDLVESRERGSWTFYLKMGKALRWAGELSVDIRLYSPHELVAMLAASGWKLSGVYESLATMTPFQPESPFYAVVLEAV